MRNELAYVVFFSEMYSWRITRIVPYHMETLYSTRTDLYYEKNAAKNSHEAVHPYIMT